MIADPSAQLRLLDLQASDTMLAQLAHRRRTLPELAKIVEATAKIDELQTGAIEAQTKAKDLGSDQRRLETEVETVRSRSSRDEGRLAGGGLPAKELESLQHEITSLARRQNTLEDELLEVMEQRETADGEVAELGGRRDEISATVAELELSRDAEFARIDGQIADVRADRDDVAVTLPEDLLALYEKVAAANGGVGAAALRHRRCEGCHLELAGNELTALRNAEPDTVVRCENCRRILVRTAESGL